MLGTKETLLPNNIKTMASKHTHKYTYNTQSHHLHLQMTDRKVQLLFPAALISFLILGTARIVFDHLKNRNGHSFIKQLQKPERVIVRLPINVSDDEVIEEGCDVFDGKWVWDDLSYPLYAEESCSYLVKQVTCQRNGRPDFDYKNWRWQPNGCNLPR